MGKYIVRDYDQIGHCDRILEFGVYDQVGCCDQQGMLGVVTQLGVVTNETLRAMIETESWTL